MKKIIYSAAGFLSLLLLSISLFSSCTRDDRASINSGEEFGKEVSFTASTSGLADTKSGSTTTILSSTEMGTTKSGSPLYLTTIQNDWLVEQSSENSSELATKADVITTSTITNHSIGVMAYKYAASAAVTSWEVHQAPVQADYNTSLGKWVPTTRFYWVNAGNKMRFYSYAPYDALAASDITATDGAYPTASFTVNTVYSSQKDLLVATTEVADNPTFENISQPLTFNHALTAVRFKIDESYKNNIKSISISGVNSSATLNLHDLTWSGHSTPATFVVAETSGNLTTKSESGDYVSLSDKYTLMMLPTTAAGHTAASAKITVTFGDNSTVEGSISGHIWEQGKIITYLISKKGAGPGTFVFDVTAPTDIDYRGWESTTGTVTSYRTTDPTDADASQRTAVGWRVEGYYKSEAGAIAKTGSDRYSNVFSNTFVKSFPSNGAGSVTAENLTISYTTAKPTITTRDKGAARNAKIVANSATLKGSYDAPYNLANRSAAATPVINSSTYTANTYIINGAGYYCFPLVMGNGIKGGSNNTAAYPSNFRDYKNQQIANPYLHTSSSQVGTPTYAVLAWADYDFISVVDSSEPKETCHGGIAPDITKWYLTGSKPANGSLGRWNDVWFLCFYVPKEKATQQGLANILILDADNTVMWSYQIWLTDYVPGDPANSSSLGAGVDEEGNEDSDVRVYPLKDIRNADLGTINTQIMMPRNLCYVESGVITINDYPASEEVYVRLEQSGNDGSVTSNYQVVKLQREATSISEGSLGYNSYYQWGRPFAMKPARGVYGGGEPGDYVGFYPPSVLQNSHTYAADISLGKSIQLARYFISRSDGGNWLNTTLYNLWDANQTTTFNWDTYIDAETTKTIYDPCPAGYKVPRANVFTAFMQNDTKVVDPAGATENYYYKGVANVKENWFEYGYMFNTHHYNSTDDVPASEKRVYIPNMGYRARTTGTPTNIGLAAYYWTAAGTGNNGRRMTSYRHETFPMSASARTYGLPIRPVKE
ncbi:MAG: fimbrillin family protein [Bacteroidales bacterium]|nr:fimbrillin family protein [Bacteroidales bacterium]